jgi:hypothetical protein
MADWTPTASYGMTGNGTNITPEKWYSTYLEALPTYDMWSQFVTFAAGAGDFVNKGEGDTIRVNFFDNMNVPAASLVEGTLIARGTQASSQVSLTVVDEGNRLDISGLQGWCVDSPLIENAARACVKNALQTNDVRIGAIYVAATSYFSCYGTDAYYENAHTGTRGTEYFYPEHARLICQRLKRLGVAPYPDGFYHAVGAPGAWNNLMKQSQVLDNAARLGDSSIYSKGLVGAFAGIAFHDEWGANAQTTYSATVGTSVIFGDVSCVGGNDINSPNLIWYYPDPENDAGRLQRVTWHFHQAYSLTLQGTTNARVFKLYHKH